MTSKHLTKVRCYVLLVATADGVVATVWPRLFVVSRPERLSAGRSEYVGFVSFPSLWLPRQPYLNKQRVWQYFSRPAVVEPVLHLQVESLMKGHHLRSSLPRFPGKKSKLWTNHGDLGFVEDRRRALEQYLKTLLQVIGGERGRETEREGERTKLYI